MPDRRFMGQTLYLECNSGISGDMTVAALLDLGADKEVLDKVLKDMPVEGFDIEVSRVNKAGLDVCDFNVKLDKEHGNHDHDMEYLHGDNHEHHHDHDHKHHHENEENNEQHHEHAHEHRGLQEIQYIIEETQMSVRAKELSLRIFNILAQAEAKAHGVEINDVYFHEVGAVDSIVDIISVAVCIDNLDITNVIVPYMCEGNGTIRCQHGILPIPVPAVANIVQLNDLNIKMIDMTGELVTPTGAAIVAALKTSDKLPSQFKIKKIGMGAGKRNYERPSILRAMLIEPELKPIDLGENNKDFIYKLETNIDDCTGEMLGYVMDILFENGARDVHYTPVYMKKNRPAYLLTVICTEDNVKTLEDIIFKETTTIGIRRIKMERTILERKPKTVTLSIGELNIKKCTLPDGTVRKYPEYESMAKLARENNISIQDVISIYNTENGVF
jgi:uncharacterized protein (TIGR00299 family) protein